MKISRKQLRTYRRDSNVSLVKCGEEYFNVLEQLIDEAKEEIQFQTYIFDEDETGIRITEALKRAADRGVKVFLIVDSFGSASLGYEFAQQMSNHKIFFRKFSPFFSRGKLQVGRRLHHKVVVIDSQKALITGINIADKYKGTPVTPPWLDFAVLIEGDICEQLNSICRRIELKRFFKRKKKIVEKNNHAEKNPFMRIRENDWARRKNQVRRSYKLGIINAESSITIVASYFLPGLTVRRLMSQAVKRGVKINLLLSEISDVPFIKEAHRFLYSWLLQNKIRVYEYHPSILHGKAMVVDEEWATIGSYNLNHLSRFSSIELNADIFSKEFASSFNTYLNEILKNDSVEITEQMMQQKNIFIRLYDWFSYQLVRLNMSVLFLFLKKKGNNRLE